MAQENVAVFTEEEQGRILYHLGYMQQTVSSFAAFGVLATTENQFIAINALQHVPLTRAMIIREHLAILDGLNQKLVEAQDFLVAKELGEMTLRDDHPDLLEREYTRWARRLADSLGVTTNPYSERFGGAGKLRMNTRVRNG